MTTLTASALTPAAERWLQQATSARVLSVFERACNLVDQHDVVLTLVTQARGLTPFGVVVATDDPPPFRGLVVASPVRLEAGRLRLGPLTVELAGASLWDPRPDWAAAGTAFAAGPERLAGLAALAAELRAPGSLLDLYGTPGTPTTLERAVLQRAEQGAALLVEGLATPQRGVSTVVEGARLLAGLGGGLTPAGDDFIVGVLLGLWAGLYGARPESLAASVAEAAAARTTLLSAAYLRAAGRGECIAHWHDLLAALTRPDWAAARTAAQALISIGHTSGADALAGFLAAHYRRAKQRA